VVHTHQPTATRLGIVGLPILPLLHVESAVVDQQPVPTFACAELIVNPELGRGVAQALGQHRVRVIPPEEIAALKQQLASPAGRWAYYAELTRR
jgi:hypothetical protein